jgi:HD-GYP domain-containing protein (c-di-GMP phosphodiesterase class II)
VLPIVRSHHERWDGKGYPDGTAGEETPLLARIVHVVDVYEALTARRVYRAPMPLERILAIYQEGIGTEFDPQLVAPFLKLLHDGTLDQIRADLGLDKQQEVPRFQSGPPMQVELRVD